MNRKFEISLAFLYAINLGMGIVSQNYVAAMAWACALLAQLRIMGVIKID
jgi:hypothetical protein